VRRPDAAGRLLPRLPELRQHQRLQLIELAAAVAQARRAIADHGVGALLIDDLTSEDVPVLGWSGDAAHLASIRAQLPRIEAGEVEYVVARAPDGTPIGKAGVDLGVDRLRGIVWQVVVHGDLQGLGIGSALLHQCEARILALGRREAALSVELDNPRARALYERLGYVAFDERDTGWPVIDEAGAEQWYRTRVVDLRKPL
jgi:ribosomal protein S18 acetylase RimI-like enzyme